MPHLRSGIAIVLALIGVSGAVSLAQRFGVFEGTGAGIRVPPRDRDSALRLSGPSQWSSGSTRTNVPVMRRLTRREGEKNFQRI